MKTSKIPQAKKTKVEAVVLDSDCVDLLWELHLMDIKENAINGLYVGNDDLLTVALGEVVYQQACEIDQLKMLSAA